MKKVILGFLLIIGLVSCDSKIVYEGKTFDNYEMYVEYSINHLKSPVILMDIDSYQMKTEDIILHSIYVKDADGNIRYFKYNSEIANKIGEKYKIGDTIR